MTKANGPAVQNSLPVDILQHFFQKRAKNVSLPYCLLIANLLLRPM